MATTSKAPSGLDLKRTGKSLEDLTKSLKLDASDMKERTGITPARLKKIYGGADPTLSELHAIAGALEYTAGGLVTRLLKAA